MKPLLVLGAVLCLVVPANAAPSAGPSSHDSDQPKVYTLDGKVSKLTARLANRGIKKRLRGSGYELTSYSSKCNRRSRIKLRCRYKFTHRLGDALGTGPACGASTVKLIRQGRALSVGATPADSCS